MKKFFFLGAIAALALAACQKQDDPSGPSKNLVYDGPESVTIDEGTYFYSLKFTANADWKVMVDSEDSTAVTVDKTKGTAGEQTVKISFEDLGEDQTGRLSIVAISTNGFANQSDDNNASVFFMQGKVFALLTTEDEVGTEGGTVTYKMVHNCEDVKCTHIDNDWATSQWNSETGEVILTAEANTTYDSRSASAVFRTEDIKVDSVSTETSEPTGIKVPAKFYATIEQAGIDFTKFALNLSEISSFEISADALVSNAVCNGKYYVSDGKTLFSIDPKSKSCVSEDWPTEVADWTYKSITNDDADNLIICNRTKYDTESTSYADDNFYLAVKKASGQTSVLITKAAWEFGGPTGAKVKVTGDITGNAMICLPVEGIDGIGMQNTLCYWQVNGGVAGEVTTISVTGFTGPVWSAGYWLEYATYLPSIVALGTTPEEGFVMSGVYDENCLYDITSDGTATKKMNSVYMCGGDDCTSNYAVQSIDIRTIGGVKYLAVLSCPQFPSYYWPEGGSSPIISLHKLADITTSSDVYQTAKFCKVITTVGTEDIQPAGEIILYADGDNVGVMFSDLNGGCVDALYFDPERL